MRKKLTIFFILILSCVLIGCESSSDSQSQTTTKTEEQQPRYSIKTETLMETITNENNKTVYTISYTYPIIISSKEENITSSLNENFKKEADDFVKKIKESENISKAKESAKRAAESKKDFYAHSSTVSYIPQYNQGKVISFLKAREDYIGGINHIYISDGITYNMETGIPFELGDVFEATNLGLIKILSNGFKTEASKNSDILKNIKNITEDDLINNIENLKWYLSEDGIVFFFNPNTIVKGTNEIFQFTYPYKGNKTMFKEIL